ncbi:MAG: WD40 repeat domain-containing protein [Bacteroidales bacterium]|nr:WD40 repeat domain-containing protein [Bacteroidales bacterium]MBN2819587.1 WD40 repeat domain-containing protein [Bacteroidales bacterium]
MNLFNKSLSQRKQFIILIALLFIGFNLIAQENDYLVAEYKNHKAAVDALAFSASGEYLATGGADKLICIIDLHTLAVVNEIVGNYFEIKDMEFYGENQLFITAGNDIKLIDFANNNLKLYEGNSTHFWSIDFAPERSKLTGGSYDRKIHVWDVNTQETELVLEGHEKSTLPVEFTSDEKYIISGSRDLSLKVWNAKSGELMKSFEKHSGNIFDIAIHPNPRYFASASDDRTIRLWDIEEGKVIKTYAGHDAGVLDVEFSPDGYFMYSASVDGVVLVWEVKTGSKLYSYNAHTGAVNSIAVSNDGNYVATGGIDSKVFLWNSAKLIAVEFYYSNEFLDAKTSNPIFEEKRKGETKESYIERKKEADAQLAEMVEKYFNDYKKKNNYINIPD